MIKTLTQLLASLFLAGCSMFGIRNSQEAAYTVLLQDRDIEIRAYRPLLIAETNVEADYANSGSIGFKRLAGYIFGNNRQQQKMAMTTPVYREQQGEKIAMTAPVLQQKSAGQWRMAFVMPPEYTLSTLPEPLDPLVEIKQLPAKKVAVLHYSGSLSEEKINRMADELSAWLSRHAYTALSPARSAAYDPPWTIPALRRNEVHIDIE
ncbi:SOUL family heme-binding protein [Methylomonas methanica]|uniref:SOUL heme-binding protein n=1 Tax=Methylomonas methanica (strain DSM 25384 / MC09) TaxID=857087 RepID=F9ZXS7_METMM|nr:heme-binding protein [Methylomonas methanica]AEG02232.1 SOUL heme-binding protein [Methylomonas methanica MC09]